MPSQPRSGRNSSSSTYRTCQTANDRRQSIQRDRFYALINSPAINLYSLIAEASGHIDHIMLMPDGTAMRCSITPRGPRYSPLHNLRSDLVSNAHHVAGSHIVIFASGLTVRCSPDIDNDATVEILSLTTPYPDSTFDYASGAGHLETSLPISSGSGSGNNTSAAPVSLLAGGRTDNNTRFGGSGSGNNTSAAPVSLFEGGRTIDIGGGRFGNMSSGIDSFRGGGFSGPGGSGSGNNTSGAPVCLFAGRRESGFFGVGSVSRSQPESSGNNDNTHSSRPFDGIQTGSSTRRREPPPDVDSQGRLYWEVDEIVASEWVGSHFRDINYTVQWVGGAITTEKYSQLGHRAEEAIADFHYHSLLADGPIVGWSSPAGWIPAPRSEAANPATPRVRPGTPNFTSAATTTSTPRVRPRTRNVISTATITNTRVRPRTRYATTTTTTTTVLGVPRVRPRTRGKTPYEIRAARQ